MNAVRGHTSVNKMMNHVNNRLKDVSAHQRLSCGHSVYQFKEFVLNGLQHFKYHVATMYGITLRA